MASHWLTTCPLHQWHIVRPSYGTITVFYTCKSIMDSPVVPLPQISKSSAQVSLHTHEAGIDLHCTLNLIGRIGNDSQPYHTKEVPMTETWDHPSTYLLGSHHSAVHSSVSVRAGTTIDGSGKSLDRVTDPCTNRKTNEQIHIPQKPDKITKILSFC